MQKAFFSAATFATYLFLDKAKMTCSLLWSLSSYNLFVFTQNKKIYFYIK